MPASAPRPLPVLVIDENPSVQQLMRRILVMHGYAVVTAACPPPLAEVSQLGPVVVVLDARLGGAASSLDFLQALRATPHTRSIPVLVCTADPILVTRERDQLGALATDILFKPFRVAEFVARVAACRAIGTPSGDAHERVAPLAI